MESLFPYRTRTVQIRVNDSWIEHAEAHAQLMKNYKNNIKVSSWDVSQRVGEIALRYFLHKIGSIPKPGALELGKRPPHPTTRQNWVIAIVCPPADERYNTGTKAQLRVNKKYVVGTTAHIAALYDPPYIDMLGWVNTDKILANTGNAWGRVDFTVSELRTMSEFIKLVGEKDV